MKNSSSLVYIPKVEDNGKELICESDNPSLPGSALRDSLILNIHCKYSIIAIYLNLFRVNYFIISRHLNDISIHKGIFCIITWSLCLILTSFFVPICVHMTRADYEWPFRKPLIWYDEFLRVTWERINGGNSMEMHLHPVFIHWKIKCHCFCWRYCLFLRFYIVSDEKN